MRTTLVLMMASTVLALPGTSPGQASANAPQRWQPADGSITSVTVKHARTKLLIVLRYRTGGNARESWVSDLKLDTNPRKRGPEFAWFSHYSSEEGFYPINPTRHAQTLWEDKEDGSLPGRCVRRFTARYISIKGGQALRLTIPKSRGCMTARKVRLHAATAWGETRATYGSDRLPNKPKRWTRWVKVGQTRTFRDPR